MHHSMHSSWSVQQLILLRSGWTRDAKALRQYLRLPEILNSELIRTCMRRSSIICSLVIAAIIVLGSCKRTPKDPKEALPAPAPELPVITPTSSNTPTAPPLSAGARPSGPIQFTDVT